MALIYLLDSNDNERKNFAKYLCLANYEVTEFCRGNDLLSELENKEPDILVLEAELTDVDGFSLVKKYEKNTLFLLCS